MTEEIYLLVMRKLLYNYKFYNTEDHSEYLEVLLSPYYREIFQEILLKSEKYGLDQNIAFPLDMHLQADKFERMKQIIRAIPNKQELDAESRDKLIKELGFPFQLSDDQVQDLREEFAKIG